MGHQEDHKHVPRGRNVTLYPGLFSMIATSVDL